MLLGQFLKRPVMWWWEDLELNLFPYNLKGKQVWLLRHRPGGAVVGAVTSGRGFSVVHLQGVPFLKQFEALCAKSPEECGTYTLEAGGG